MTAYFERFDCNKIVPVVSSRQEFSMLHHLLVVPPHFCIGMDWPLSQVAIVTTRIFYIFGLLHPTAITGKGDDPNIWVTGGSRYSRENEHSPLLKWWLGYYLPLEMLPFFGGYSFIFGGVYIHFSCHVILTLRTCLGRVGYQKPMISDSISGEGEGGDINVFFRWSSEQFTFFEVIQRWKNILRIEIYKGYKMPFNSVLITWMSMVLSKWLISTI